MKKITSLMILMLFFAFVQDSFGQVSSYTYQKSSGTYANQASSSSTALNSGSWDDNIYSTALPFAFTFNGTTYASGSTIYVDANGFIYFGGSSSSFPSNYVNPLSYGASVNGIVSGFNQDLSSQTSTFTATVANGSTQLTNIAAASLPVVGTILSGTGIPSGSIVTAINSNGSSSTVTMSKSATSSGSNKTMTSYSGIITQNSGTGIFYIQWANAENLTNSTGNYNFQIALNQTTNTVNIIYGSIATSNNSGHQIGVAVGLGGSSTSDYNDLTSSGSSSTYWSNATNAGTSNSSTLNLYSSQLPSSGLTYTWTPAPNLTVSSSSFNFSNTVSGNSSATQTFTISGTNLTGYPGNITVNAPSGFLVYNGTTWVSSYTIPYTSSILAATTISVQFAPTAATSYSGNITFSGGGDATPPTVALSGTGTASQASNVITNSGYTYTSPVLYANYQTASGLTAANSIGAMGLTLQDGGGAADADNLSTTLTAISFSTGGSTAIRTAALFVAGTKVSEVVVNGGTSISFSGLSIAASDNSSTSFELRVTYQAAVTDQQQIQFTVTSATASSSGSGLAASNGGGAVSSIATNNNRISVVATKLVVVQQTSNVVAGVAMSPSVTIKEVDALGNIDTHDNYQVTAAVTTTTETFTGGATTIVTPSSGLATFSNLIFSYVQSGVTIAGTASGLTATGNSSSFNVTASQASNIIANSGYAYTSPVLYANYQTASGLTTSNSVGAMGLILQDGGGSPDADNLSTTLTAISFSIGGSTAIRTAALFVSGVKVSSEIAVNGATSISFSGLSIAAADNSSNNFELRVTYQSTVTDQQQIQFSVTSATASSTGSGFAASNGGGAVSSVSGNNNRISVVATKLVFVQQPTNVSVDSKMSPAVTVKEVDALGNTDTHDNYAVSVAVTTTSETFTTGGNGATTTVTPSSGLATFSNLVFTSVQNGVTIGATAGTSTGTGNSNLFNVTSFVSSAGDYFETGSAGDWAATSPYIWLGSHDGNYWYSATAYPTSNATSILVQNNITISTSVSSSNLSISGASINVNGAGGNLNNYGTISGANASTLLINSGGSYTHALNGGTIPTASWNIASNCVVSGVTSTAPSGLGQGFGNFTWSSNLSSDLALNSALKTINGNFTFSAPSSSSDLSLATNSALTLNIGGTFTHSGGGDLQLSDGSSNPIINVAGNLVLSAGGTLDFGNGSGTGTINLSGNFSESNGTDRLESGFGSNGIINFVGTAQSITSSGTTGGNISNVDFNINNGSTVTLLSGFTLNNTSQVFFISSTLTVLNGGVLICGNNNISGVTKSSFFSTNSTFVLSPGGTIQIGSTAGITAAGTSSGNIQTATRTFNQGGNYIYNASVNQATGTGLPTTLTDSLTINNKASVALTQSTTVSGTLLLTNGNFNQSPNLLTFGSGAIIVRDNGMLGSVPAFGGTVNVTYANLGQNTLTQTTGNELPASAIALKNLTINKAGANITFGAPATVNGVLALTNGLFTTSSGALLSLSSSASTSLAISDYTNTSYVNGPLQKTGNSAFIFPVGKLGTGYLPIGISATTNGSSQTFTAEYIHSSA
ncbi:MAG TPA: hypothetical protein VKT28_16225, partial [Puia sp.]|nr:hypothetical protein [Puia sp.]